MGQMPRDEWAMTERRPMGRTVVTLIGAIACVACHYDQYNPTTPPLPTFTIQPLTIRPLGVLSGGTQSAATSGSATTIVGWATDGGGLRHAVQFAGGQALRLAEPASASTSEAHGVNAAGVIVGEATIGGIPHAVSWQSPTAAPVILPTLGGAFAVAQSINDLNLIVGVAQTDTGDTVIVLWSPSANHYVATPFDSSGGVDWQPVSIDNIPDVAGNFGAGAFLANADVGVDTIAPPSAGTTVAHGMNAFGVVVGAIVSPPSPPRAFAFTDAAGTVPLGGPPAGYAGITANSVSDSGIVAATASTSDAAGLPLKSTAAVISVTNLSATFSPLPSLDGGPTSATDNAVTPCGAILGRAASSGTTPLVAVAWIPDGCTIP